MAEAEISKYADFGIIRYAQLWEDTDVLLPALGDQTGKTLVSICAAGDNALAMLTLDPKKVVAIDLSAAQISCLKLRMAAYKTLTHIEFIELSGSRPSNRRGALLDKVQTIKPFGSLEKMMLSPMALAGLVSLNGFSVSSTARYSRSFNQRKR